MDFKLSEEQEMIRQMAQDFVEQKCAPTIEQRDQDHEFNRALVNEMAELGFLRYLLP